MTSRLAKSLILSGALLMGTAQAHATEAASEALVIVNSGSLQTQGMAMVLANAMQAQGTSIELLLCDQAGDLALNRTGNQSLQPLDATPEQLLQKLQQGGATVNVCALYLPNSAHGKNDLRQGVGVATPPNIAAKMTAPNVRVYNF